ncbi:hypothetical protein NPIL_284111 [Nephila pilipes]|uniref:Uncharacterized protein n=1 Tax=Nephila pilipes TaxID=299642 RepID=A0A8X6NEB5_NEPPI|nr:hypothetical protein NPIL_284111 [Nephila pilipes]
MNTNELEDSAITRAATSAPKTSLAQIELPISPPAKNRAISKELLFNIKIFCSKFMQLFPYLLVQWLANHGSLTPWLGLFHEMFSACTEYYLLTCLVRDEQTFLKIKPTEKRHILESSNSMDSRSETFRYLHRIVAVEMYFKIHFGGQQFNKVA